jgi:tetratricopeptide (TPR) repeat protein
MRTTLFIVAALFLASPTLADVVNLTDGTKIEGTLKREPGGWSVTDAAGKVTTVPDEKVESVTKSSNLSPADIAASKVASQRRAVEALSDVNAIIERWNKFIEQNKGTPAEKEGQKELVMWKERLEKGMIKVGTQWMTPADQAALLEKSVAVVDQVRTLIKSGKLKDAEQQINQLVTVDTANPAGYFLRGVVAFKQDQLGVAKKAFEQTKSLLADHGPTLNNLGVIAWKQKQAVGAVAIYDMAMQASPRHRQILDNTAEALNAVPPNQRNVTAYTKALKRFQEQDAELAREMEQQGLYRWGAAWVPQAQMAELKKAQEKVKEKLDLLAEDYERIGDRIREIENRLDTNDKTLGRILRDGQRVDPNGNVINLRPPSIYYEIRRENDRLKDEKVELITKLEGFEEKALRIQQDVPVPQFTGQQRIIEVEGTPLVVPGQKKAGAATQPVGATTRPVNQPATR